ncbi:MAG: tRNA 2-thiouridine(34) synthase MnmA [Bacteroidales bacterium]|nr:tRNA 2-thiouridine(34) synthase MnmA [Porphyromonas sp.]MDD6934259.1 tRNA 2-thiouridine(34) synthase MnmA [Bacteroidales bacterium]MDY3101774.1 tRNA 2-thiouridine(34) synthase MnmA [Porphyromonas sp.]
MNATWSELIQSKSNGNPPKIAVLASGGVDSSVAVHLLVEAGFRPDLFYIKIGMEDEEGFIDCPAEEDMEMVTLLARKYDLSYQVIDLHKEYWDRVVSYTIESVRKGLTPNPDMMCNKLIKFGVFEERVGHLYDYIATGHYASTVRVNGKTFLATAPDPIKDQTDFLAQINFKQISKLLFPLGDLTKQQVRTVAQEVKLANAHRKDSQGICFLGKINYNDFIERYLGKKPGRIIEYETGKTIGTHQGFWFHTIGQRKGLGLSGGPWFVVKKDCKRNIILVSRGYDPLTQYGTEIWVEKMDFITEDLFDPNGSVGNPKGADIVPITLKIRHTPEFIRATIERKGGGFLISSETPIQGIAPGQYAVVYDTNSRLCFGSGMIINGK